MPPDGKPSRQSWIRERARCVSLVPWDKRPRLRPTRGATMRNRRVIMTVIGIVGTAACMTAGSRAGSTVPQLGMRMPCKPKAGAEYVIASAQTSPGCSAVVAGTEFFFGTADKRSVAFVSTSDRKFRTPEGVAVGSTLSEVLSKGGGPVVAEPGWGYYSVLPSGWVALFPGVPGVAGASPTADSVVIEVFLRR
jgi:hypothetical protein